MKIQLQCYIRPTQALRMIEFEMPWYLKWKSCYKFTRFFYKKTYTNKSHNKSQYDFPINLISKGIEYKEHYNKSKYLMKR